MIHEPHRNQQEGRAFALEVETGGGGGEPQKSTRCVGNKTPQKRLGHYTAWRAANKEEIAARRKALRLKKRDEINRRAREAYAARPELRTKNLLSVKMWRAKNPEKYKAQNKRTYEQNKEKSAIRVKLWSAENAERRRKAARAYRAANAVRLRANKAEWQRKKRATVVGRLVTALRARVYEAVASQRASKGRRTMELIGCDGVFLRGYLEARFKRGMSWDNYGSKWVVDHRIPCAAFNLQDAEEQRRCFHYSNLQPLWRKANSAKSAKLPAPHQAELI